MDQTPNKPSTVNTEAYSGHPKMTEEQKQLHSQIKKDWHLTHNQSGTNYPVWKGDDVGYEGLHSWIRRNKGKPTVCIHCGSKIKVQWANKSHKYKRDLDDWISLCPFCHRKFDKKYGFGFIRRKYGNKD